MHSRKSFTLYTVYIHYYTTREQKSSLLQLEITTIGISYEGLLRGGRKRIEPRSESKMYTVYCVPRVNQSTKYMKKLTRGIKIICPRAAHHAVAHAPQSNHHAVHLFHNESCVVYSWTPAAGASTTVVLCRTVPLEFFRPETAMLWVLSCARISMTRAISVLLDKTRGGAALL